MGGFKLVDADSINTYSTVIDVWQTATICCESGMPDALTAPGLSSHEPRRPGLRGFFVGGAARRVIDLRHGRAGERVAPLGPC